MDLVTGALGLLPYKLLELLNDEYKLQKGVRADVKSLSRELESMYAALAKVATVPWEQLDDQVKVWACEVREASYDMEDVIDSFIIRVGGGPVPAPANTVEQLMKKMGKLFHLSKLKARHDIVGAIEDIKKQLQEMSERRNRYKIDYIVGHPAATANVDPRHSVLYTEASELVGIDEPRDKLIKMLSIGDKETNKIVSVVGFGGLGKTTLVKAVYDKVNLQFDCRAFVPVGQNPDPKKVLRDIFYDFNNNKNNTDMILKRTSTPDPVDLMELDERQLIKKLRVYLEGKRYLIVVDDIWDTSTWGIIKYAFVDSSCGSKIIITTRISEVAKIGEVFRIEELSDTNSKILLHRKTFGGEERCHFSAELDEVSEKIIRKCQGVPLAIVTIAGVLANKPQEEWSAVYDSIGFGLDGDEKFENMKKILSFSYYDLPCHLRTCLLYLSIFLEESPVAVRDLIFRWIAEGFIQEDDEKEFVEIGLRYIHELIGRSMVIPIKDKGSGLLVGCRVHSMVLHLICDLSSKENFVLVLSGEQQPPAQDNNIRRLALRLLLAEIKYKNMQHVRSFNATICDTKLIPQLSSFKVLRVLVLEFCIGMEGYPLEHIANLLHLRYLMLAHTPVRKLPKEIGRLQFLQTLILNDTGIEELPVSVCKLTRLMCLRVDKKMSVPEWIGKLTSLVELEMYHEVSHLLKDPFSVVEPEMYRGVGNKCSTSQFVKELGKLTNLRVLKTGINLENQGQGRDFLESLRKLEKIQTIDISFPSVFFEMDVVNMEPSFALSSSLQVLDLFNVQFPRLPAWINAQDLPNLCQLTVVVRDEDEQDLTILGKFRELRKIILVIIRVHRLKIPVCGCGGFQNLISFQATIPVKFGHGAMPKLESINFSIHVAELKDANIGLEFGLENLSALRSLSANFDCDEASPTEVHEAEAALKHALDIHPNHPAVDLRRINEDKMGPVDSESRIFNRHMYKVFKAKTLKADVIVQKDLYSALYNEAAAMARSVPKEHPSVAKLALLQKQLAGPVESMDPNDVSSVESMDPKDVSSVGSVDPEDLSELAALLQKQLAGPAMDPEEVSLGDPKLLLARLLQKQLANPLENMDPVENMDPKAEVVAPQLMKEIEDLEQLLEIYSVQIPQLAAIVEELKALFSPQQVQAEDDDGVDKIYNNHVGAEEKGEGASQSSAVPKDKDLPPMAEEKATNSPAVSTTDSPTTPAGGNNSPPLALVDFGSLMLAPPRGTLADNEDGDLELDYSLFDVNEEDLITAPPSLLPVEAATAFFNDDEIEMSASQSRALQDLHYALTSLGSRDQLLAGSSDLQSILTDAAPLLNSKTIAAIQEALLLRKKRPEVEDAQERLRCRQIQEQMLRALTADAKLQKQRHDELVSACKENASLVHQGKAKVEELKEALSLAEKNVDRLTAESAKLKASLAKQRKSMMDAVAAHKANKANIIPGSKAQDEEIIASVDRTIATAALAVIEEMRSSK